MPTPIHILDECGLSDTEKSELLNLPSLQDKIRELSSDVANVSEIRIMTQPCNEESREKAWHGKVEALVIIAKTKDGREVITKVRRTKKGGKKKSYKWNWRAKWKWSDTEAVVIPLNERKTMVQCTSADHNTNTDKTYIINKSAEKVVSEIASSKWRNIVHIVDDMYQRQLRNLLVKRKDDKMTEFGWQVEGRWVCRPHSKLVEAILQQWFKYIKSSLPWHQKETSKYFRPESAYDPEMVRQSWLPYIRNIDDSIVQRQRKVWKEFGVTDYDAKVKDVTEPHTLISYNESHIRKVALTMTGKQLKKAAGFPWIGLRKRDVLHRSLGLFESKSLESIAAYTLPTLDEVWKWKTTVITPGIRTQATGSATKSRLIHIVPCDVFLRERAVWIKAWEQWNSDVWYGKDDLEEIGHVIYNKSSPDVIGQWIKQSTSKYNAAISVDWSSFDASLSKALITDIITDTLSTELGQWYRKRRFIFKSPWNDINNEEWRNGLLSGSQLTSWIGSKWNAAMIRYFMSELDIDFAASVQGDDGLIFINASSDVQEIVKEIAGMAKKLGFTMHPDKVYARRVKDTKKWIGPPDPIAEYLKRWYFCNGEHRLFIGRAMNRLFRRERELSVDRLSEEEEVYLAEKFSDHLHILKHYDSNLEGLRYAIKKVVNQDVANVIVDKLFSKKDKGDIVW